MILRHCLDHIHRCIYYIPQNEDFTREMFTLSKKYTQNTLTSQLVPHFR